MSAVRCCHFTGRKIVRLDSMAESLELAGKDGFVWLDFDDPTPEDLGAIAGPLGLHPLSIEDCLDRDQVPKIEDFASYSFVLFNTYTYAGGDLAVGEIDFFLGRKYLVTVHGHNAEDKDFFRKLEECVERNLSDVGKAPDMLMHVILDYVVDRNFAAIENLQEEVDNLEEKVLQEPGAFKPELLLRIRQHLLELRKSLFHEREILIKICRRDCPFVDDKSLYSYRDVYDHLAKFYEFIEITREMVSTLMELFLTQQNNRLSYASNQTNTVMKRLTLINTIFMPLTLLAGIGGMSEWTMMTGPQNWAISFPLFVLGMAVLAAANYLCLKWADWV